MLKTRVITAAVLICILLAGLFLLPPLWTVFSFGAVFALGAWEWAGFGALRELGGRVVYVVCFAILSYAAWQWTGVPAHLLWLLGAACVWWLIALLWLSWLPAHHHPVLALVSGIPVLVPAFIAVARLQVVTHGFASGPQVVLWLLLMVIAADVGGYFAGRSLGHKKLAPRVSPGKTLEGALGGLLLVALVAWAGAVHFGLPPLVMVAFGCAIGVYSIIGDLTESMFKRAVGLKDSGKILPGHGGLLDRIDGVTAAAALYALGFFGSGVLA